MRICNADWDNDSNRWVVASAEKYVGELDPHSIATLDDCITSKYHFFAIYHSL